MRRGLIVVIAVLVVGAVWLSVRPRDGHDLDVRVGGTVTKTAPPIATGGPGPSPPATNPGSAIAKSDPGAPEDRIAIADALDDPAGSISQDLKILRDVFSTWLTNFPQDGNPVGENAEITAALTGRNRLGLALIQPGNRAINARGELVDRWGTPFRLHQLSGTRMEIQSAGPDRRFATPDDVVSTP